MMTRDELLQALDELPRGRSAWIRGVRQYAREMVADLDPDTVLTRNTVRRVVLNGATDAREYSEDGWALIYNSDIAKRVCTPSQLRRARGGDLLLNREETWLDVQTRAIHQALALIHAMVRA